MASVWIPSLLRPLTLGEETVSVPGRSVGEVIDNLEAAYPGIKARLCDGGGLRPGIAVAIDGQVSRAGLTEAVGDDGEVHFLPSIGGG